MHLVPVAAEAWPLELTRTPVALPRKSAASFARTARDVCHLARATTPSCDAFFRQAK